MPLIFYLCMSLGSATDVAILMASNDAIYGITTLPNDCFWVEFDPQYSKAVSIIPKDTIFINNKWYLLAKCKTIKGQSGFSAGYPFTS